MGDNMYGQLGDGTYNTTNLPGQIVASNVVAVAGANHSLFLKTDGSLWAMGYNQFGQLGKVAGGAAAVDNSPHPVPSQVTLLP